MLTLLHPLVDFCSVAVLAMGGLTIERWLAYNAIAFALQLPLGLALDMRKGVDRSCFAVGCLLAVCGVILAVCGCAGWISLCLACLGNALFHLTAGMSVLRRSPGKSGPVGLFISTGAFGLLAGQMSTGRGTMPMVVAVAMLLIVGMLWQMMRWPEMPTVAAAREQVKSCSSPILWPVAVSLLFAIVVWRSWAGLFAGSMSANAGLKFLLLGAIVKWSGKTAGGFLADAMQQRFFGVTKISSRVLTIVISVVGSAALCFCYSPSDVVLWLVLLFLAQLATGPVLSLMYDRCGRRAGTAFGLNCFGLFTGSLV